MERRRAVLLFILPILVASGCADRSDASMDDGPTTEESGDGTGDGDGDGDGEPCEATMEGEGPTGFYAPCNPSATEPAENQCCSTDPSEWFSNENNDRSQFGQCLPVDLLPPDVGLANGCPIPCNPSWDPDLVTERCGLMAICCHTRELSPDDCVLDPDMGCYRPVAGLDIDAGLTSWGVDEHGTHQDPGLTRCNELEGNEQNACIEGLGAADQRGFCLQKSNTVVACPLNNPDYVDACEQLNQEQDLDCG